MGQPAFSLGRYEGYVIAHATGDCRRLSSGHGTRFSAGREDTSTELDSSGLCQFFPFIATHIGNFLALLFGAANRRAIGW